MCLRLYIISRRRHFRVRLAARQPARIAAAAETAQLRSRQPGASVGVERQAGGQSACVPRAPAHVRRQPRVSAAAAPAGLRSAGVAHERRLQGREFLGWTMCQASLEHQAIPVQRLRPARECPALSTSVDEQIGRQCAHQTVSTCAGWADHRRTVCVSAATAVRCADSSWKAKPPEFS